MVVHARFDLFELTSKFIKALIDLLQQVKVRVPSLVIILLSTPQYALHSLLRSCMSFRGS